MSDMIDWMKTLTWRCDICGTQRVDEKISVRNVDITPPHLKPGLVTRHLKYCNDSDACRRGAENWKEPNR